MKTFVVLADFVLTIGLWVVGSVCGLAHTPTRPGLWSTQATALLGYYPSNVESISVPSPDGRKVAIVRGVKLCIAVNGHCLKGTKEVGVPGLSEFAWSPDSQAFFITASDGGIVGTWDVYVFQLEDGVVREINLTSKLKNNFKHRYSCLEQEEPNVGAVGWVDGSKRLLLVAEVPPHSNCAGMGSLRGYVLSVPSGTVLSEYDERELKTHYGPLLGSRIADVIEAPERK